MPGPLYEIHLGEEGFNRARVTVSTTYRCGRPVVCLEIGGEDHYLTHTDADKLADELPDILRLAAEKVAIEVMD